MTPPVAPEALDPEATIVAPEDLAPEELCQELDIGWSLRDTEALLAEFEPYTRALFTHIDSGTEIPTHIPGASSICVPVSKITDPWQLFEQAEGSVAEEEFVVDEYDDYWVTTHFSTVPVVILLLKKDLSPLSKLEELWRLSTEAVGRPVGGYNGSYFQWNQPGFGWTLHTDDEYEGVDVRVHVPLITTPQNIFSWARTCECPEEEWLLTTHLEMGKVYSARTDIPHTAINRHPTDGRLHLILDVPQLDSAAGTG